MAHCAMRSFMKHRGHYHPTGKKSYFWPIIFGVAISSILVAITIRYFYYNLKPHDQAIAAHVEQLKNVFTLINKNCTITGFDQEKNAINFLNVGSFIGSNVGSMHLEHPEHWHGPYLKEELKVAGKPYQIVLAKNGYYILPGDGITLANGKVMGKDIVINANTDMEKLITDPEQLLSSNGKPLAALIPAKINPFELMLKSPVPPISLDED